MNKLTNSLLAAAAALATTAGFADRAAAQGMPNMLLTFSNTEQNVSGSGGTVLGDLLPNEINYLQFMSSCNTLSAEKWQPRTCSHVMAGDENGDGLYFRPGIFGRIDGLLSTSTYSTAVPADNQRTVFWSVAAPMGNNVSALPFRPGDVARIRRILGSDGQVQHFMRQEHFNSALGLAAGYGIDIDAIAWQPNYGVFFSVDVDVAANTMCGPTLVRDGDVLCIPGGALNYTPDMRVAGVAPNSAFVVYTEAEMDAFTNNAGVANRFGACVNTVQDVEALELDLFGPVNSVTTCTGVTFPIPNLIYACETGTGASLLQTAGGGSIWTTPCGLAGTPCAAGPTWGMQLGVRPATTTAGVASHVNALAIARACVHVLEPKQHVMTAPAPAGANAIDYNNPFVVSLVLIEIVPPVVPPSSPAAPFSPTCFPDLYAPSIIGWLPVPAGFGSIPTPGIPAAFSGKVLFQGVGFGAGTFELSTPAVLDVL